MAFKNTLCVMHIPEYQYSGRSPRYACCQRKANHEGEHRSWSRKWNSGDQESKPRNIEVKHEQ